MFGFEETLTPEELEAKQSKPMKNMGKTKQTNENKEKAEADYYVGNWDTEGRAKLEQLSKRRLSPSSTRYEKWDSYDKYLPETHLVEIRKKHLQHEKHRSAALLQKPKKLLAKMFELDEVQGVIAVKTAIQQERAMKRISGVTLRQF